MSAVNINLYQLLKSEFNKAKEFTEAIIEIAKTDSKDIQLFSKDIAMLKQHIDDKFASKDDIINQQKWMIGLFVTLVVMILGLYAAILLK